MKYMTYSEMDLVLHKNEKLKRKNVLTAKKKIRNSWGVKDGRKFIKNEKKYNSDFMIYEFQNDRGLIIIWKNRIIGLDNWGNIVHKVNIEPKFRKSV